jgi:uncharacterized protein (DUF2062 family)
VLRFVKFRVLHIDDSEQRMSRGIAIGVFVAYSPFFGLHMLIALILAQLIRANKALAVMAVWLSNPLTFVFVYYPSYLLGRLVLPLLHRKPQIDPDQVQHLLNKTFSLRYMLSNLFSADYWKQVAGVFTKIGLETCIGGVILGTIFALISYWISFYFIIGYRTRKQSRQRPKASESPTKQCQ